LEEEVVHSIVADRDLGGKSVLDAEWVWLAVRRRGSWRGIEEEGC
jgi:hypothetical protein